jgi:hypothetical protein
MRARLAIVLTCLSVLGAACGGVDAEGGATGATGSEPSGATGSAEIARFAAAIQDTDGGNILSFSGTSCDGILGPYQVLIASQGNVTGETTTTLSFVEDETTTMSFRMTVTEAEGEGTISGEYDVELSPLEEAQTILFSGTTTAEGPSGNRSFETDSGDLPVETGTGACPTAS